jgi:hypothetical protein
VGFGKRMVNAGRVPGAGGAPVGVSAASVGVSAAAIGVSVRAAAMIAPVGDQLDKSPVDVAWLVLEAANDLGDEPTVEACRRIIDASLNGKPAPQADLILVTDYFR